MNLESKNRIPSLDGLRAVSIFMVLISHAFHDIRYILDLGNLGVRMFFIISSYLITGILYRDVVEGRFSLRSFYIKRIMRTFPAFYFYLISIFCFLIIMGMFDWGQLWRAPIYLENYHPRSNWGNIQWFVGHSWSLAVEEQFYVIISILFLLLNNKSITKYTLIKILIFVIAIVPFVRVTYFMFDFFPYFLKGSVHRSFETVCDALAVGALGYLLKDKFQKNLSAYYNSRTLLFSILVIFFLSSLNGAFFRENLGYLPRFFYNLVGISIVNFAMIFILYLSIANYKEFFFTRILNHKILIFVGILSYSIYLWQQPWLYSWDIPITLKFLGVFGCSLFSYYLVEAPILKLRNRLIENIK